MMEQNSEQDNRELYAILNLSPESSDEEIRKAYRQWAQAYHPDKYQNPLMKDAATENFQRVCEAYEILSDPNKRQVYDIYGMEGLKSGLELGSRLDRAEEIKAELERLKRRREHEKMVANFQSSGTILANLSMPQYLDGDGLFRGMAMTSEVQSQLSKRNVVGIGGNLAVEGHQGGGAANVVLSHQLSEASSIEFIASAGLRSLIGVQTSRVISSHSSATAGLSMSLRDGSLNLSNAWTRQLSETTNGHIQLMLGSQPSVAVGWKKEDERRTATAEVKLGTGPFETSARYTHRFSSKSHGCIGGRFGSSSIEMEVGGGRKLSKFSTVRWLYVVGLQGISWRFEFCRGGQKLIIPVLLTNHLNPMFATGALVIPASFYFVLKKFVIKPYYRKRNKQKALEKEGKTSTQVQEARAAAEKAQKLQQNVANRKRNKQLETSGLVIMKALYGSDTILNNLYSSNGTSFESTSGVIDVTTPLNFLVNDSGQLKLHEGVKKSGIMGFCDPCPGETKLLYVEYAHAGNQHKVLVGDYEELVIPQGIHRGGLNMEYYLPIIVMLLIQLIFAGQTLGTRMALLEGMSPRIFVVYRSAFATIVLAPLAYLSGRNSGSYSLNLRSFSLIFMTSLIGITLNQNLYFEGLYLSSSSVASAISNLLPAVTFVIAALVGMEKVNIRSIRTIAKIVGTIICVSGAVSIALLKGPKLLNADKILSKSIMATTLLGSDENWLLGCLSLLGCTVAWGIFLILQVPAYASHPNYLSLCAWMCFMATLQSALVTLFLEPDFNGWKIKSLLQFGSALYAGVMGSAVIYCLQAWCISRRGPLFSAMFTPVFTIICTVLAAILLHEEIYIGSLIGAIGVIIGLYIVLWGKAEEVVDIKENIVPKSMEVKIDLEEPLLPDDST